MEQTYNFMAQMEVVHRSLDLNQSEQHMFLMVTIVLQVR